MSDKVAVYRSKGPLGPNSLNINNLSIILVSHVFQRRFSQYGQALAVAYPPSRLDELVFLVFLFSLRFFSEGFCSRKPGVSIPQ